MEEEMLGLQLQRTQWCWRERERERERKRERESIEDQGNLLFLITHFHALFLSFWPSVSICLPVLVCPSVCLSFSAIFSNQQPPQPTCSISLSHSHSLSMSLYLSIYLFHTFSLSFFSLSGSTYESASTAGFKHGRTETIRSATIKRCTRKGETFLVEINEPFFLFLFFIFPFCSS